MALVTFALQQYDRAADAVKKCVSYVSQSLEYTVPAFMAAQTVQAELYLREQQFSQAWQAAAMAEEYIVTGGDILINVRLRFVQAHIANAEQKTATLYYGMGQQLLDAALPILRGRAYMDEAYYQVRMERPDQARPWLEKAISIFQSLNADKETVIAQQLLDDISS
jgi:hypothetical protein